MKILDIPKEVYLIAIDYEGFERPDNEEDAERDYQIDVGLRGWTDGGLERAISEYLQRTGPFAEGYLYADVDGWEG